MDHGNGIICRNGYTVTTSGGVTTPNSTPFITYTQDIRDGMSNTFSIGEAVPQFCPWSAWYWFDGTSATCAVPLNYKPAMQRSSLSTPGYLTNWQQNYSFMSRHPGGANFGFCDGSGRFVSDSIQYGVYEGLATIDGGEQVQLPP